MNANDIKAELEKRERELEAELAEVRRMLGKAETVPIQFVPIPAPYPTILPGPAPILPSDPYIVPPFDYTPRIVCGGEGMPSGLDGLYFRQ